MNFNRRKLAIAPLFKQPHWLMKKNMFPNSPDFLKSCLHQTPMLNKVLMMLSRAKFFVQALSNIFKTP